MYQDQIQQPAYNTDYANIKIQMNQIKTHRKDKLNYGLIEKLSEFGLNKRQIAEALKFTYKDFDFVYKNDEKLRNAIEDGKANLRMSILTGQLRCALPDPENNYIGNASLLKHLGNVHCGQNEVSESDDKDIHIVLKWNTGKKNEEDDK